MINLFPKYKIHKVTYRNGGIDYQISKRKYLFRYKYLNSCSSEVEARQYINNIEQLAVASKERI